METIYIIENDRSPRRGFFSYLQLAMTGLYCAHRDNIRAVVDFSKGHEYQIYDGENVWERYFFQPYGLSMEDARKLEADGLAKLVVLPTIGGDAVFNDQLNSKGIGFAWLNRETRELACQIAKRIAPKEEIFNRIYVYYLKSLANTWADPFNYPNIVEQKIIGVHKRGGVSDMHGEQMVPDDIFFKTIDTLIEKHAYNKIFLATNQEECLNSFSNRYGSLLVYQPQVHRLQGIHNVNIHELPGMRQHLKEIADDVVSDCLLLSKCDIMLHTLSSVSRFALYMNPNLKYISLNKSTYVNQLTNFEDDGDLI